MMLEFIQACKAYPKGRFGKLPQQGAANFTLVTKFGDLEAAGIVRDKKFYSLRLSKGEDYINVITRTRPVRRANPVPSLGSGVWMCGEKEERILEGWFNNNDTLEAVYHAQVFLYELKLLVNALEAGTKTKQLGI